MIKLTQKVIQRAFAFVAFTFLIVATFAYMHERTHSKPQPTAPKQSASMTPTTTLTEKHNVPTVYSATTSMREPPATSTISTSYYVNSQYNFQIKTELFAYDNSQNSFGGPRDIYFYPLNQDGTPAIIVEIDDPAPFNTIDEYLYSPQNDLGSSPPESNYEFWTKESGGYVATTSLDGITAAEMSVNCDQNPHASIEIYAIVNRKMFTLTAKNVCGNQTILPTFREMESSFQFLR